MRHKRVYLAPALTWRPSDATSWTLLATHSREPDIPDYNSLPAVALGLNGSRYPQVDRRRNFSDMGFQGSSRKQDSISSLFEHTSASGWKLSSNLRYMVINSDIQRTSVYGYQDRGGRLWLEGTYGLAPSSSHLPGRQQPVRAVRAWSDLAPRAGRRGLCEGHDTERLLPDVAGGIRSVRPDRYRPDVPSDFSDSKTNWPYNVRQEFTRVGSTCKTRSPTRNGA